MKRKETKNDITKNNYNYKCYISYPATTEYCNTYIESSNKATTDTAPYQVNNRIIIRNLYAVRGK